MLILKADMRPAKCLFETPDLENSALDKILAFYIWDLFWLFNKIKSLFFHALQKLGISIKCNWYFFILFLY